MPLYCQVSTMHLLILTKLICEEYGMLKDINKVYIYIYLKKIEKKKSKSDDFIIVESQC